MGQLRRKAMDTEQSQSMRGTVWLRMAKVQVQNSPTPWDSHPAMYLDARHKTIEFNVWPAEFWFCFGLTSPFSAPIPPFWNRNIYYASLYVANLPSALNFLRTHG